MSTILISGGAGFIGSHISKHLLDRGHEVVILDDLSGGSTDNIPPGSAFVQGSICDVELVKNAFNKYEPDYVIHAAAYAAECLSAHIRNYNYTTNVVGSMNLINESIRTGVKCFVFLSSIAVYGKTQEPPFLEDTPMDEADPYAVAKGAVERDLKCAKDYFGLNSVVFRPFNVYGPGQRLEDPFRNFVGIAMNQVMKGKPITVFGEGTQRRGFSYIDDVAPAIASAVDEPDCWNQTFNIGGAVPYTVLQVAAEVCRQMDVKYDVVHLPPRKEAMHAFCSSVKARRHFGEFMNDIPLHEGIAKMAAWAKKRGPQSLAPFTAIELHNNLPPSWAALLK